MKPRNIQFEMLESRRVLTVGPTPVNDNYNMIEDTSLIIGQAKGVIANDINVSAVTIGIAPKNGSVILNRNGSFGYTPRADFVGVDSFTYYPINSEEFATVSITVTRDTSGIDAVNDYYETEQNTNLTVNAAHGVIANDVGVIKASLTTKPQHGRVTLLSNGSFSYTPNPGFHGVDTFSYRGSGRRANTGGDIATVSINVYEPNVAPVATDDFYQMNEDGVISIDAQTGVLGNDTDTNSSDILTVTLINGPQNGTLQLNRDGSFEYTPNTNWWGYDGFDYLVSDGLLTDTGHVDIGVQPVNDPPVAIADYLVMNEDNFLILDPILENDIDIDAADYDSILKIELMGNPPLHGGLRVLDDQWIYEPEADYFGEDQFMYRVWDQQNYSEWVLVTVLVMPVNDRPTIENDFYGTVEDVVLEVPAEHGVLRNDFDKEGDAMSAIIVDNPKNGSICLNLDGSFTYIPNINYYGSDSFTYRAIDAESESFLATVILDISYVDDTPWVNDDEYTVDEDDVLIVEAPGVLANDVDVDMEQLSATLIIGTSHGELQFMDDGGFYYIPDPNFNGVDEFQYIGMDEGVETLIGYVRITVNSINDNPFVRSEIYEIPQDTTLTTTEVDGVLINDEDADDDTLITFVIVPPQYGTLTLTSDGSITYTPNAGFVGDDRFDYRVDDQHGGYADGVALIRVLSGDSSGEGEGDGNNLFRIDIPNKKKAIDDLFAAFGENEESDLLKIE